LDSYQKSGVGFGYGKRSDFTHIAQQVENPGPGQYKTNETDESKNVSKNLGAPRMSKEKRDLDHISRKHYARHLEHRLLAQESPGPGYYAVELSASKKPVIPKSKRHLSEVRIDYLAGPTSYSTLGTQGTNGLAKMAIIGREERNFDPIRYSGTNKAILLKGLL
jgi:hypothetical protein